MTTDPTMKTLVVAAAGGPFVTEDRPRPTPGEGQVLVQVRASGVNPLDTKIRAGAAAHARHAFPAILGLDLAGVVVGVGPDVDRFKPGDEVYGMAGGVGDVPGSLSQYALADAELLARKPRNLGMREAAAMPLIFTAWEGLVDRAKVGEGQTVLVQGGAGGVGHMAVQIAKAFGAEVFATHTGRDAAFLTSLGATPISAKGSEVDDYVAGHTAGRGFDIVYDTGGGRMLDASFASVAIFGHVVSCLGWGAHALAPLSFRAASYSGVFTLLPLLTGQGRARHGEILSQATRLVEAGLLKPRLDPRVFDFGMAEAAHDAVRTRTAQGKVVVSVS